MPPARAGAVSSRIIRPSRKRPSRFGASRKSSAERDGGVSTTMRSHSLGGDELARASPSPCTPASRRRRTTATGRRGWRRSARPVRAWSARARRRRTSASCPASSRRAAPLSTPFTCARGVVEFGQPHRLGEPSRRVDREHHGAPSGLGAEQRHRRGRRRLAHAAAAARDDDPGARDRGPARATSRAVHARSYRRR